MLSTLVLAIQKYFVFIFGSISAYRSTNWEETDFGHTPEGEEIGLVLPLCLKYLTPEV